MIDARALRIILTSLLLTLLTLGLSGCCCDTAALQEFAEKKAEEEVNKALEDDDDDDDDGDDDDDDDDDDDNDDGDDDDKKEAKDDGDGEDIKDLGGSLGDDDDDSEDDGSAVPLKDMSKDKLKARLKKLKGWKVASENNSSSGGTSTYSFGITKGLGNIVTVTYQETKNATIAKLVAKQFKKQEGSAVAQKGNKLIWVMAVTKKDKKLAKKILNKILGK